MSDKPKIKVATAWLGGCSGCHMSFLDLDERLIDLAKLVEFTASPITDVKEIPPVDVGIVEGAVCNEENEHVLRTMRAQCKVLIALGDCAISGNIPALRNCQKLQDVLERGLCRNGKHPGGRSAARTRSAEAAGQGAADPGICEGGRPYSRLSAGCRRDLVRADRVAGGPRAAMGYNQHAL